MTVATLFDLLTKYGPWGLLLAVTYFLRKTLLDEDRAALFRAKFYKIAYSCTGRVNQEKRYISNGPSATVTVAVMSVPHITSGASVVMVPSCAVGPCA